jgi:O-antigen ligase
MFAIGAALAIGLTAGIPSEMALWQIALVGLAFQYGRRSESLDPLWAVLTATAGISSVIAVGQALALPWLPPFYLHPAGLFYSPAVQAAMIALVMIAVARPKNWFYMAVMLPGLGLAQSRGGWLVLGVGLAARWRGAAALVVLAVAGTAAMISAGMSDQLRLATWKFAFENLTWFGAGAGAFAQVVFPNSAGDGIVYPGHVHNDYLELAFEYGLFATIPLAVIAAALCRIHEPSWPVFAGYAALSAFYFPLYCAPLAFVGVTLAGHLLRTLAKSETTRYHFDVQRGVSDLSPPITTADPNTN